MPITRITLLVRSARLAGVVTPNDAVLARGCGTSIRWRQHDDLSLTLCHMQVWRYLLPRPGLEVSLPRLLEEIKAPGRGTRGAANHQDRRGASTTD